jgi:hypothetical protein
VIVFARGKITKIVTPAQIKKPLVMEIEEIISEKDKGM